MAVTNDFSWSKTRDEIFRDCLRKYYFHYYGAWGGWAPNAPPRTRQLYILKNLQARAAWVGDRVHRAIHAALATLPESTPDGMAEQLLATLRQDFRDSINRRYHQYPRKTCGLFEHEYALEIPDEQWKATADHAVQCLQTFFGSDIFIALRQLPPDAWLEAEELASFTLDGIKVYVQLDFAHRTESGLKIFDWKTGRAATTNAELQLACYTLYAVEKWHVAPEHLQTVEFNLASGTVTPRQFAAAGLETMQDYIRDSADEMSFLLEDTASNKPQTEAVFEFTEDAAACHRCNFLKACPRWS